MGPEELLEALIDRRCEFVPNREVSGFRTVPPTWEIKRRRLEDQLFYYVVAGICSGYVAERRIVCGPGTLLWVPAGTEHRFKLHAGQSAMTLYNIRFQLRRKGRLPASRGAALLVENIGTVQRFFQELVDELQTKLAFSAVRLRALLQVIVVEMVRCQQAQSDGLPRLSIPQRQQLLELVRQNSAARLDVAALAACSGLSLDYFSRVFRRSFGIAPRLWLVRERIRLAAQRLCESNMNVTEVSRAFGYEDIFLFSRQFKRVLGSSPREYKRRHTT